MDNWLKGLPTREFQETFSVYSLWFNSLLYPVQSKIQTQPIYELHNKRTSVKHLNKIKFLFNKILKTRSFFYTVMHFIVKIFSFILVLQHTVSPLALYNDLIPLYEGSQETTDTSESVWLLLEEIQGLASFIIKNVSQICPIHQPDYFERVEKLVLNTLAEIYENEEILLKNLFYENILPSIKVSLEKCARSSNSKISQQEFTKQEYPDTIFHVDLAHRSDINKWVNFRPCIRTQIRSKFYPGTIPSTIDTLWQTFLLGYLGCNDFWGSLKEWNFLDLVQQIIIRPLFQRWSSKFPKNIVEVNSESKNTSSEFAQNESQDHASMSFESISMWFEKCNVILFLRHTVDPIPCFRDVIHSNT